MCFSVFFFFSSYYFSSFFAHFPREPVYSFHAREKSRWDTRAARGRTAGRTAPKRTVSNLCYDVPRHACEEMNCEETYIITYVYYIYICMYIKRTPDVWKHTCKETYGRLSFYKRTAVEISSLETLSVQRVIRPLVHDRGERGKTGQQGGTGWLE